MDELLLLNAEFFDINSDNSTILNEKSTGSHLILSCRFVRCASSARNGGALHIKGDETKIHSCCFLSCFSSVNCHTAFIEKNCCFSLNTVAGADGKSIKYNSLFQDGTHSASYANFTLNIAFHIVSLFLLRSQVSSMRYVICVDQKVPDGVVCQQQSSGSALTENSCFVNNSYMKSASWLGILRSQDNVISINNCYFLGNKCESEAAKPLIVSGSGQFKIKTIFSDVTIDTPAESSTQDFTLPFFTFLNHNPCRGGCSCRRDQVKNIMVMFFIIFSKGN